MLLKRASELKQQYKETEALALYEEIISAAPDNFEALCSASLLHNRMGERYADDSRKLNHFNQAKSYALRAYEIDSLDANANYAMALSLVSLAMMSGPKQRLAVTNQVKHYLDAALRRNATHADAWHLLGRWYFKMANLNFAEVAAAKMLFGGIREKVTNQDAISAIEAAITQNPNNLQYYYDLACIFQEMKDKAACASTLQRALSLNQTLQTKEELELSRRCKIMLDSQQR
ncbi:tetratricopeptide repeat protein [Pontibacter roseus]|uniref:tetratricopeptide repeat protein n=1 Tax=Pontibacter roseus TaxID=336989 RepID=UPI00037C3C38|nr:tetratricopeptide repeat protein [Pontibacter roseus]